MSWNLNQLKPAIVSIGDELLYGEIQNTNVTWIQERFVSIGIPFQKLLTVGDDIEVISLELKRLIHDEYFPIIVTGGLGGTHDDVTREAVSKALDVDFCIHNECLDQLHQLYKLDITDQRKRMAILPKECTLIPNPLGAPGFYLSHIYAFPGFPQMFKPMVQEIIQANCHSSNRDQLSMSYQYNTTEGVIAIDVEEFALKHQNINVGIYGNIDSYLRETTVKVRYNSDINIDQEVLLQFFLDIASKHNLVYKKVP